MNPRFRRRPTDKAIPVIRESPPSGPIDTREAHRVLMQALDLMESQLDDASIERLVEVGSVLWDFGGRITDILDKIKDTLRQQALANLGDEIGVVTLDGDDLGKAMVHVLSPTLRVPRGKNVQDIKQALSSDFALFFDEVTTFKPRRDYEERVLSVENALHKRTLLEAVERVESTPRVSFTRGELSKQDSK